MGEDEVLIKVFQQPVPVLLRQRRRAQDERAHAGFRCATGGSSSRLRSTIVTLQTRTNSIDHRRSLSDTSLGNSTRATDEGSTIRTSAICAAMEYCPNSAEPVNRSSRKTFVRRRRKPSSVTR